MDWIKQSAGRKSLALLALAVGAIGMSACSGGAQAAGPLGPLNNLTEAQLTALGQGLATGGSGNAGNGITVTGTGVVNIDPDLAVLSLGVQATADTVAQARSTAADRMNAMLDALHQAGISDNDIKTQQFQIQARYQPSGNGSILSGFMVTNTLTVKVHDISTVGDVIDKAAVAGGDATRVNGVTFTVQDPRKAQDQARKLALQDAQAKADVYAGALGVKRGALLSLSETGSVPTPQFLPAAWSLAAMPTTPIQPGEFAVTVNVQAVFATQ